MAAESERRVYTRAGRAYFILTNALSLVATAWLMTDPFDWIPPMDYFSARGALFLLAVALGLAIALGCMLLLFALIALALEKLGAKFTRPAGS
jgi:hypothetical protein